MYDYKELKCVIIHDAFDHNIVFSLERGGDIQCALGQQNLPPALPSPPKWKLSWLLDTNITRNTSLPLGGVYAKVLLANGQSAQL